MAGYSNAETENTDPCRRGSPVAKDSQMARSALVSRVLENGPTPLTFHLTAFQNMSYLLWRECDEKGSRTKFRRPSALDHSTIWSAARTQCLLSDETGISRCIAVWKGQLWEMMGPEKKKNLPLP